VLVVALGGSTAAGHWGGLLTRAARNAGLAGVVVDGAVRDAAELARLGLPVFHRGLCPRKAVKQAAADVGVPVLVDGVAVRHGDLIVADVDGVAAVDPGDVPELRAAAAAVVQAEAAIERRLRDGAGLGEAFDLPGLP
jgi:4-hydroxy-4-methyl-2-oxoglutarate aldolase